MKGIRAGFPKYVFVVLIAVCVFTLQANITQAQGVFNLSSLKGIYVVTGQDLGGLSPAPSFGVVVFDGLGNVVGGFMTVNLANPAPPPARITVMARITGGTYTIDHPLGGMGRGSVAVNGGPMGVFDLKFHYVITEATAAPVRLANEIYAIQDDVDPFSGGVGTMRARRR